MDEDLTKKTLEELAKTSAQPGSSQAFLIALEPIREVLESDESDVIH
jgi:hypothetical protein